MCELPRGSNHHCGGPRLVAYLENLPYDCPFIWHTSTPDNDFFAKESWRLRNGSASPEANECPSLCPCRFHATALINCPPSLTTLGATHGGCVQEGPAEEEPAEAMHKKAVSKARLTQDSAAPFWPCVHPICLPQYTELQVCLW